MLTCFSSAAILAWASLSFFFVATRSFAYLSLNLQYGGWLVNTTLKYTHCVDQTSGQTQTHPNKIIKQ